MVGVVNDGRKIISCRCGNYNLTSAGIDMSLCLLFAGVESGALQNYIYLQLTPRAVICIRESINLNLFTTYSDGILTSGNLISMLIFTLRRIIF